VEAGELQLPVLPRRLAIDPEIADRGGRDRRRRAGPPVLDDRVSACCRRRRSSCSSVNIVFAFFETFGDRRHRRPKADPGQATQILVFKVYRDGVKGLDLGGSSTQSVVLMAIVIALTIIQFRYVERKVQY
jgi:hypothetical protein